MPISVVHNPEILTSMDRPDFKRLGEILPAAFGSIALDDIIEYVPRAIAAESADVIVSRNSEGLIASVMVVNLNYGLGKFRGQVDDVATHLDSLRQGHSGAVLDFAIDWFCERGVRRVSLTSNDNRKAAHELYKSRGFKIHETNHFQLDLH